MPASLPFHFSRSASASIGAKTTSAVTVPSTPGVQALGTPVMIHGCAPDTTVAENRSFTQPRPNVPHDSMCGLLAPHSVSRLTAQSAAALKLGEPVSLGPYTSVSQLAVSITCERWKPSSLIL